MPCYHPIPGWKSKFVNPSGKRSFTTNPKQAIDEPMTICCGQCIGCRLGRSREWAIRLVHESKLYENNSFVTLTYANDSLPKDGSLHLPDIQNFMKRLRFNFGSVTASAKRWRRDRGIRCQPRIRFYQCGEYGEKFGRPHWHLVLFNCDFQDKELFKTVRGNKLYVSDVLEELWEHKGHATIGDVTFESAAYVARYVTKKITGQAASNHYMNVDYSTGEIISERRPEFATMSRRPGIGKDWFQAHYKDWYPDDFLIMRDKKMRPPKYYDRLFEHAYPEDFDQLREERKANAKKHSQNNTPERREVREKIQQAKFKQLKRGYENGSENI